MLRVEGVRKRFSGKEAVAGVDLEVRRGEYVCILGPSGSGKSTLLRLVAGFEAPDQGRVELEGISMEGVPPEARPVHTVFQGYALFPHLTVAANVEFGLRVRRIPAAERRARVAEALELVGLPDFGHRRPGGLSGGEQQRVALARALVNRPPLLLLDEPLAALDRRLRLRMQEELRRIQRELGIAFLHVTHDQEEALRLSDRVAVMDGGRVLQVGPPREVYHRPAGSFVADFLGSANLLPGRVEPGPPPSLVLAEGWRVPRTGGLAEGAHGGAPAAGGAAGEVGVAGTWAVRPEVLRLEPVGAEIAEGRVRGRVESRLPLGGVEEFRVRIPGALLRVHVLAASGGDLPGEGDEVVVVVDPRDLVPLDG